MRISDWGSDVCSSDLERDTTPTEPLEKILPGMMPILHSPGVSTPGQFGPMRRDLEPESARFTFTMSSTGMPSVMQTISRSEEHTSELQSLMRISYAVFCLKKKNKTTSTKRERQ